ncbi:hypothetical protein LARI1_G007666 [Lachnellula arida]|uniref:Heterokaryon incompatibility domain-containing protein n=1 Tax=Lachnellula arida TaxID=1316785 RepID=A0A8T9B6T6_9HELO|nr:hypothetical protein LARI1_G007666 [Lachnellula arida]
MATQGASSPDPTVKQRASDCRQTFSNVIDSLQALSWATASSSSRKSMEVAESLQDQLTRFDIWSANIGVFSADRSSLDYRVMYYQDIRDMLLQLLGMLHRNLLSLSILEASPGTESHPGESTNEAPRNLDSLEQSSSETDERPKKRLKADSEYDSSSDEQLSLSDSSTSDTGDALQSISETISRLQRLSNSIRQASLSNRDTKADAFLADKRNLSTSKEIYDWMSMVVKAKYPNAKPWLQERVARSLTRQRGRFLYRKRHQEKLNFRVPNKAIPIPEVTHKHTEVSTVEQRPLRPMIFKNTEMDEFQPQSTSLRGELLSETTATQLKPDHLPSVVKRPKSSKAGTISPVEGSRLQIPPAPEIPPGATEFECPYCCIILPSEDRDEKRWRQHVVMDIDPYICLFESCSHHEQIFNKSTDWLGHMEWEHTLRWSCNQGDNKVFDNSASFEQHMTDEHPRVVENSGLDLLTRIASRPLDQMFEVLFEICPLCDNSPINQEQANQAGVVLQKSTSVLLQKHIEDYLISLAILSLPPDYTNEAASKSGRRDSITDGAPAMDLFDDSHKQADYVAEESIDKAWTDWFKEHDEPPPSNLEWEGMYPKLDDPSEDTTLLELYAHKDREKLARKTIEENPLQERGAARIYVLPGAVEREAHNGNRRDLGRPPLCQFCYVIDAFFRLLDPVISEVSFLHHDSVEGLYSEVRGGCEICTFIHHDILATNPKVTSLESRIHLVTREDTRGKQLIVPTKSGDRDIQLCYDVCCERGSVFENLDWTSHRVTFEDPSGELATSVMKDWMAECRENHLCAVSHSRLPTRILEIDSDTWNVSLRNGLSLQEEYATLSSCWGRMMPFGTTLDNLHNRMHEIKFNQIPKTYQDAIGITRKCGIRYLWIDALCIIQDDAQDWKRESSKMMEIFGNSSLNISGARAINATSGFLGPVHNTSVYTTTTTKIAGQLVPETSKDSNIIFRRQLPTAHSALAGEPLFARAWALQEHIAAPRGIYFGSSRLVWSCQVRSVSDDSETPKVPLWRSLFGLPSLSPGSPPMPTSQIHNGWKKLVEYYSTLHITFSKDKLNAIGGIARELSPKLEGDEYLAGLWRNALPDMLLWRVSKDDTESQVLYQHSLSPKNLTSTLLAPVGSLSGSLSFEDDTERTTEIAIPEDEEARFTTGLKSTTVKRPVIISQIAKGLTVRGKEAAAEPAPASHLEDRTAATTKILSQSPYIAPSWSWASIAAPVKFDLDVLDHTCTVSSHKVTYRPRLSRNPGETRSLARISEVSVKAKNQGPFSGVTGGYIRIDGIYVEFGERSHFPPTYDLPGTNFGDRLNLRFDGDRSEADFLEDGNVITVMPVQTFIADLVTKFPPHMHEGNWNLPSGSIEMWSGLILSQVPGDFTRYNRIGVATGFFTDLDVFRTMKGSLFVV